MTSWSVGEQPKESARSLSSTISFSDFSMHVMDDEDVGLPAPPPRVATKPVNIPHSHSDIHRDLGRSLNLAHIKTPISPSGSKSLNLPSVASIFGTPKIGTTGDTPRSSLDLYDGAVSSTPTPTRTSADGEESMPVSPKSPRTPGGKKRKQKINGYV